MDVMCTFCGQVFTPDTYMCWKCNEYKGLMPLDEAVAYLDLPIEDFPELTRA